MNAEVSANQQFRAWSYARRLPRMSYVTGGLEDPAIREAVCAILEGGKRAFQERAKRLRVSV